jgi:hypothetical protein
MFNDVIISAIRHAPSSVDLRELGLGVFQFGEVAARRRAIEMLLPKIKYWPGAQRQEGVRRLAELCGLGSYPDQMMSDEQVRQLHRNGIEIGAHTVTHPILTETSASQVRVELAENKRYLETLVGEAVTSFAYPNGNPSRDYRREHVELVREAGFELAVTTAWGAATRSTDPLQLPRIAPWGGTPLRYGMRIATAYRDRQFKVAP